MFKMISAFYSHRSKMTELNDYITKMADIFVLYYFKYWAILKTDISMCLM